ncbi:diacylglycerol/lipid kinase family protein [Roseovarius rhodophyticola]|uniref:Diacylglycerol kinase family protein n=1 Tax=Roseovarius rhodophyticola TaxID=3080827 RepID=A0ABZ2THP5_9RHOB|nr:diacylglycerol kinase family protein [Roseovarius sp. W115]MDV2931020.1 diacylglycerol kinase family protein [Roseovarius sp. W115]
MDAKSIAFVTNPKSHRVARKGSWVSQAAAAAPDLNILEFSGDTALMPQLRKVMEDGVSTIFIEGGDGTVLAVLSACHALADQFETPPQFAILPGGSTNLAHKLFGFRAFGPRHFQKRFAGLLAGKREQVTQQRALKIDSPGLSTPQLGFVLSTGTLARAMRYVQEELHGPGHRGSFSVGQAILRFLSAPHAYLDQNGQPVVAGSQIALQGDNLAYDGPHGLSIMTSLPRLSLGLYPFWGEGSGSISLTYATWPMPHFRRGLFQALVWKQPDRLEKLGFFSHREDAVKLTPHAPIMIDGESFDFSAQDPVHVTLSDQIRFLR